MAKIAELKPEDIVARGHADRLLLEQLTELEEVVKVSELADRLTESGLGLAAVKSLLASNPERFAYHERRWIPASRLAVVGRPFEQSIRSILESYGAPMSFHHLHLELSRASERDMELSEYALRRTIESSIAFVVDAFDRISLIAWGFFAVDELRARALALNSVTEAELAEAIVALKGINFREKSAISDALKKATPISLKMLGAVAWSQLNPEDPKKPLLYDAKDFQRKVLSVPGYIYGSGGLLVNEEAAKKWVSSAIKLAEKLAPTIDIDDALPIEIKPDDISKLVAKIEKADGSYTATKLLEEFYEITPSNKTFPDDLGNIEKALHAQPSIVWVGGDRFQKKGQVPEYILSLPEIFQYPVSGVRDQEGELVDVELTDEGLSQTLRKLLSHPLAIDVLDEERTAPPKVLPETMRLVLKAIHREVGTFPICQLPEGWIPTEPKIQELIVINPEGKQLQIWVNQEDRMTYNWIDWWLDQSIENGAVFTLTKTTKPNVLEFAWHEQPDPVVYISTARMEELRTIGENAEGKSTLDILIEVMAHWTKGADYLTVLAEVNIARRTTRRLIASLLSSYQCFYQRSGSPVWHYDPKKIELGFDKTKRKFVKK